MSNSTQRHHQDSWSSSSPSNRIVSDRRGSHAASSDFYSRMEESNLPRGRSQSRNDDRRNWNPYENQSIKPNWFRGRSSSSLGHHPWYQSAQRPEMIPSKIPDMQVALPMFVPFFGLENSYLNQFPQGALQNLHGQLMDLYRHHVLSENSYNSRMETHKKLQALLRDRFPSSGLYIIGSTITGLGAASADMDLCWMVSENEFPSQTEAIQYLRAALDIIIKEGSFGKNVELIYARVPILRFVCSNSGVQCEINVNNPTAIRNTYLLCHYAVLDPRVRPLSIAVKVWAQRYEICSAWKGGLSSYSWELLLINYLQSCYPPVVPSLQVLTQEKFDKNLSVRYLIYNPAYDASPIKFKSENQESLAALFLGFFRYYSEVFNFPEMVASVRLGKFFESANWVATLPLKNEGLQRRWINIEEPYDLINTARGVATQENFSFIQHALRETYTNLISNFDLSKVLPGITAIV